MCEGFLVHYTAPLTQAEALGSLKALGHAGLALTNPLSGATTILSESGEQVTVTCGQLVAMLGDAASGSSVTFQMWLDGSVDVVCAYTRLSQRVAVRRYWLDGLDSGEVEAAIAAVAAQLALRAPRTLGFGIDRHGASEELELDEMVRVRVDTCSFPEFAGDLLLLVR